MLPCLVILTHSLSLLVVNPPVNYKAFGKLIGISNHRPLNSVSPSHQPTTHIGQHPLRYSTTTGLLKRTLMNMMIGIISHRGKKKRKKLASVGKGDNFNVTIYSFKGMFPHFFVITAVKKCRKSTASYSVFFLMPYHDLFFS